MGLLLVIVHNSPWILGGVAVGLVASRWLPGASEQPDRVRIDGQWYDRETGKPVGPDRSRSSSG